MDDAQRMHEREAFHNIHHLETRQARLQNADMSRTYEFSSMFVRSLMEVGRDGALAHPLAHKHDIAGSVRDLGDANKGDDVFMAQTRPDDYLAQVRLHAISTRGSLEAAKRRVPSTRDPARPRARAEPSRQGPSRTRVHERRPRTPSARPGSPGSHMCRRGSTSQAEVLIGDTCASAH
jgi:hypothetical protein